MSKTIVFFLVISACGLGYALGYWHAQAPITTSVQAMSEARPISSATESVPIATVPKDRFSLLLEEGAWFQLEQWLVANAATLQFSHGEQLQLEMRQRINKYDAVAMRRVLRAYLNATPEHLSVMSLLSDLQQVSGLREAALETFFDMLALTHGQSEYDGLMVRARQIISAINTELKAKGALAEREAFWRHTSQRVPSSDYFRLQWANALANLKRYDEALRLLAETGTADVSDTAIAELRARIEVAAEGLQFQRDGDRLLSTVTASSGQILTLLVDTGANITSLSKPALRALSAQPLGEQVRVRTASGIVETGVYTVRSLEVQGVVIEELRVLELPTAIPDLDGLLGVDVLNRLSIDPIADQMGL